MPGVAPRPETQEEILQAALAGLSEHDIPSEDDAWVITDSDCDRPAELAGLDGAELDGLLAASASADPSEAGLAGSVRVACWTGWRRGWRLPGLPRARTPGWPD